MDQIPNRSALKRATGLKKIPTQCRSLREGVSAAIADARHAFRARHLPRPYVDAEDFFGVRLSDSTDGRRFIVAYDEAIEAILRLTQRPSRRR
jgi:hypothetical protein